MREILFVSLASVMSIGASASTSVQTRSAAPAWIKDAVFYQIFPERFANGDSTNDPPGTKEWGGKPTPGNYFGGDLSGILQHLDYLSSLGINALYLNPIFASNSNHKYRTADYRIIDPHFGDEETFRELVDSCHARGIRIILDGVFNHTGVDFFAFADAKKNGARSRYKDWYTFHGFPVGPVSAPNYECWWGHGSLPKLNTKNPEVRQYLFDVTRQWMETGIDGWRLDVPNEIPHEFWKEWRALVKSINPEAYIVGEIWEEAGPWLQGDEFDGVMNYRYQKACGAFFAGESIEVLQFDSRLAQLRREYSDDVNASLLNLLDSHDTERFLTMCKGDVPSWKLGLLFHMTYPGVPMLYYGDEVGMTGGKDPACRGTMVWDPARQNRDMLEYTRRIVRLRRSLPVLRHGGFTTLLTDADRSLYAYMRRANSSSAIVVLNCGNAKQVVSIPAPPGEWRQVWPVEAKVEKSAHEAISLPVPPRAGMVITGEEERTR
jgi:glycosidase